MPLIDRLLDRVASAFGALAALLLGTMVAINLFNIVSRSVFGHAFGWVFNWTLLMFVWVLLFGFYVYVRRRRDVVVDVFVGRLPRPLKLTVAIAADVVGILVMLAVLRGAPSLLALQTSNMDSIDLPIFVRTAPMFLSAVLILVHFANHIAGLLLGTRQPFADATHLEAASPGTAE